MKPWTALKLEENECHRFPQRENEFHSLSHFISLVTRKVKKRSKGGNSFLILESKPWTDFKNEKAKTDNEARAWNVHIFCRDAHGTPLVVLYSNGGLRNAQEPFQFHQVDISHLTFELIPLKIARGGDCNDRIVYEPNAEVYPDEGLLS